MEMTTQSNVLARFGSGTQDDDSPLDSNFSFLCENIHQTEIEFNALLSRMGNSSAQQAPQCQSQPLLDFQYSDLSFNDQNGQFTNILPTIQQGYDIEKSQFTNKQVFPPVNYADIPNTLYTSIDPFGVYFIEPGINNNYNHFDHSDHLLNMDSSQLSQFVTKPALLTNLQPPPTIGIEPLPINNYPFLPIDHFLQDLLCSNQPNMMGIRPVDSGIDLSVMTSESISRNQKPSKKQSNQNSNPEGESRNPALSYNPYQEQGSNIYFNQTSRKKYNDQKRNYQCTICWKRFIRPSTLQTHLNSHTGKRPFACPKEGCGMSFSVSSNLRRHIRTCIAKDDETNPTIEID